MKMMRNIFYNFNRYRFLMNQMIIRDFKVKYKRSVLGVLWSLLYPLLMMSVMAIVFSQMFKFKMEGVNFLVYLMSGLIMFNYFSEASSAAMASIVSNFSLMSKVYIPKYIFPLSKCLFAGINFLLSLIPLLLIVIVTGAPINIYYLLLPYGFACLFLFTLGIGLIMATVSVFLRDMFYIYGIVLTIWNYFTPIFYGIHIIPEELQPIFQWNPLYQYITFARSILLDAARPSLTTCAICGGSAILMFIIGCIVFKSKQDKFIYYI